MERISLVVYQLPQNYSLDLNIALCIHFGHLVGDISNSNLLLSVIQENTKTVTHWTNVFLKHVD